MSPPIVLNAGLIRWTAVALIPPKQLLRKDGAGERGNYGARMAAAISNADRRSGYFQPFGLSVSPNPRCCPCAGRETTSCL